MASSGQCLNGTYQVATENAFPNAISCFIGNSGHTSMPSLGDIVMLALWIGFAYHVDAYKQLWQLPVYQKVRPFIHRVTYIMTSIIGSCLGLLIGAISSEVLKAAQPARLYILAFTLLPLLTVAYLKGDLRRIWQFKKRYPPFWMDYATWP